MRCSQSPMMVRSAGSLAEPSGFAHKAAAGLLMPTTELMRMMASSVSSRPVATKTAEGYGRAEEDLPVDIVYSKLIDFLVAPLRARPSAVACMRFRHLCAAACPLQRGYLRQQARGRRRSHANSSRRTGASGCR